MKKHNHHHILKSSFVGGLYTTAKDVVHEASHVTHALVHAIEQPLAGVWTEAKTVAQNGWNVTHVVFRIAAFWTGGWLAWTWLGNTFPQQKRMLTDTLMITNKRARR